MFRELRGRKFFFFFFLFFSAPCSRTQSDHFAMFFSSVVFPFYFAFVFQVASKFKDRRVYTEVAVRTLSPSNVILRLRLFSDRGWFVKLVVDALVARTHSSTSPHRVMKVDLATTPSPPFEKAETSRISPHCVFELHPKYACFAIQL